MLRYMINKKFKENYGEKMRLKNKIAIVTGGSQGIGEAICYAYAKEGANVIVVNKNHPKIGEDVANKIKMQGGFAHAIECDVADETSVSHLIEKVINTHGRIDILVNNASVVVFKNLEEQTLEDWNFVIDTNLKGSFLMSKAVIPHMKKQKYGKIIFTTSIANTMGFPTIGPYSATKAGMLAMAKTMVAELARYNINVNCISPGSTDTPQNQLFLTDPKFIEMLARRAATGEAMQPCDLAGAAVFLASDESSAVHGLDLIVDNAQTAAVDFY